MEVMPPIGSSTLPMAAEQCRRAKLWTAMFIQAAVNVIAIGRHIFVDLLIGQRAAAAHGNGVCLPDGSVLDECSSLPSVLLFPNKSCSKRHPILVLSDSTCVTAPSSKVQDRWSQINH